MNQESRDPRLTLQRLSVRCRALGFLGFMLLALFTTAASANEQTDRRVLMGLRLFPALVAADQDLAQKRGDNGELRFVLLYRDDPIAVNTWAKRLAVTQSINNIPIRIDTLPYSRLSELTVKPPAALFLAEWSPDDLADAVRFGIKHHRIVFSPFKGDVRSGATAGIFISDRMLPLVNHRTLDAAGIRLEPFLLNIAKTHE